MSELFKTLGKAKKSTDGPVKLDAEMLERIDELYRAGTKRLSGAADWYEFTFHNIQSMMEANDVSGETAAASDQRAYLFVDLLAATSPRCSIIRNTFLTTQLFNFINDAILCKVKMQFEAHLNNVCRALLGLPLSGQKVTSFQANLLGDNNAVTVDSWMMRVFGKDHDNPSAKEYEDLAAATRKVAKIYGITPAQMQAALWVGIKAVDGDPSDTPEPFEETLQRFKVRQDAQGVIDFAHAESKFGDTEASLAAQRAEASNPPEPRYSSPRVIGPRLREVCIKEALLPGEIVDIICEQPSGLMMEAILFVRDNIDKWESSGDRPFEKLVAHLEKLAVRTAKNPSLESEAERILRRLS